MSKMKRGAVLFIGLIGAACAPTGTPELVLTSLPTAIRANGAKARLSVRATNAAGEVGSGTVNLRASAGSLVAGLDVQLDSFGSATAEVSCDGQLDALCQTLTSLRIVGTWTVTGELRMVIDPEPPTSEARCADGYDEDEDGLTDCADPDCEAQACEDGLKCTVDEVCTGRVCSGGVPRSCVTPATPFCASGAGTCDPQQGCVYPAQNIGLFCSDESDCTTNDRCNSNGRCVGVRVVCDRPPGIDACYGPGNCTHGRGCEYPVLRNGTSCGSRGRDRCCSGRCVAIDEDWNNCGSCGVVCPTVRCRDAVFPSGCGPAQDTTGRCECSQDRDCPRPQSCSPSGVCFALVCKVYQTARQLNDNCPTYCIY